MNNEHGFIDPVSILFYVLLGIFLFGVSYKAVTDPAAFSLEDAPPTTPPQ